MLSISEAFEGKNSSLFKAYKGAVKIDGAPRSEREDLIKYFHERAGCDRKGRPFAFVFVKMRLQHLTLRDLYYLKSICDHAENFSRCLWVSIKPKVKEKDGED